MATSIYKKSRIRLVDGEELEISPLKIAHFRDFMDAFEMVKLAQNDDEAIVLLLECARICMRQFKPELKKFEDIEDALDLATLYEIIDVAAGIKINRDSEEPVKEQAITQKDRKESSWDTLDLAKLELEAFLLGTWKNFDELEKSLCITELIEIVSTSRELSYEERKFMAAIQGVDLEKNSNKGQKEWEDLKARVFSRGKATDSNDILALQGQNAVKAGFGIGMGLDYEDRRN